MSQRHEVNELLVRYLDGRVSHEEATRVQQILRGDDLARAFLCELAEQAVMVADLDRTIASRQSIVRATDVDERLPVPSMYRTYSPAKSPARTWQISLAISAVALFSVTAYAYIATAKPRVATVIRVTGASQFFSASGRSEDSLRSGASLVAGDVVESRSCDAWITLDVDHDATLTIAGNSAIRVQCADATEKRFELIRGSLWFSPSKHPTEQQVIVQTPTLSLEFQDALLNVQTSAAESVVRVHSGVARVTRRLDGQVVDTIAGHQTFVSLGEKKNLTSALQPTPISEWSSRLMKGTEVLLGNWLPSTEHERARLGAAPLLWPIPDQEPVMLYAAAIAAWRCSDQPVWLHADSTLRFRGRIQRAQSVRFGFSAQKMCGVFAGKFEIDIPASSLGQVGDYWEVELPLSDFQPLHPQLASSPESLELTDVYVLTIIEDAGLEITDVELRPVNIEIEKMKSERTKMTELLRTRP